MLLFKPRAFRCEIYLSVKWHQLSSFADCRTQTCVSSAMPRNTPELSYTWHPDSGGGDWRSSHHRRGGGMS